MSLTQATASPVQALPFFLCALQLSQKAFAYRLRLRCVCRIAQCRASISPTAEEAQRSLRDVSSIWGEVVRCTQIDKELSGMAHEIKARCVMLSSQFAGASQLVVRRHESD